MNVPTIEQALKATLADHRLTRSEGRALKALIGELGADPEKLAFARNYAFKIAREAFVESPDLSVMDWLEDVVKVLHPSGGHVGGRDDRSEAFFSPNDSCVSKIRRLFEQAKRSADVCVFTITDDRIVESILTAHRRRVAVRIISDNDKSNDLGSDIDRLSRLGVPVRVDRSEFHMHHKFAVFDNKQLLTGSYNWTRSAARDNEENFIVTNDPSLVTSFRSAFEELWGKLK